MPRPTRTVLSHREGDCRRHLSKLLARLWKWNSAKSLHHHFWLKLVSEVARRISMAVTAVQRLDATKLADQLTQQVVVTKFHLHYKYIIFVLLTFTKKLFH